MSAMRAAYLVEPGRFELRDVPRPKPAPDETLSLDILTTIHRENSVKGSVAGMGEDMHDALTLLTYGRIDPAPFSGAEYPLERIQDAFDSFADRPQDLKSQIVMAP